MSSNLKSLLFWAVLLVLAGMLFVVVKSGTAKKEVHDFAHRFRQQSAG